MGGQIGPLLECRTFQSCSQYVYHFCDRSQTLSGHISINKRGTHHEVGLCPIDIVDQCLSTLWQHQCTVSVRYLDGREFAFRNFPPPLFCLSVTESRNRFDGEGRELFLGNGVVEALGKCQRPRETAGWTQARMEGQATDRAAYPLQASSCGSKGR